MLSHCFIIVCILLIFGCAGSERVRTVQDDNIFYSSSTPKIRIKINSDFKLDKETDNLDTGFSTGYGEKSSTQKITKFLLIDRVSGKRRGVEIVIVELTSPGWSFNPKIFKPKNQFDSGKIKIQGNNYQYCTYAVRKPNNYLLVKGMGRIVGAKGNAMILIYYLEQATGDWSNKARLITEQIKQLNEFIEDSKRDIQILEN
jgi:hypothetical protein